MVCQVSQARDLHGDGDDGNPAESAGNPREWVQLLREYRWHGTKTCGNTACMEFIAAGNLRVCFGKRAVIRFLDRPLLISECGKIIFTSWTDLRWLPLSTVCWLCGWTVVFAWTQVVIPSTVHLLWLCVIHVLFECYYFNIVTQRYFSVTMLKKLIETVRAHSIKYCYY